MLSSLVMTRLFPGAPPTCRGDKTTRESGVQTRPCPLLLATFAATSSASDKVKLCAGFFRSVTLVEIRGQYILEALGGERKKSNGISYLWTHG